MKQHVDVFIPQKFMECRPVIVFAVYGKVGENKIFLNCTFSFKFKTNATKTLLTDFPILQNSNCLSGQRNKLRSCLGVLCYENYHDSEVIEELRELRCPAFVISVGETKNVTFLNWNSSVPFTSSVILYDSEQLFNSELLLSEAKDSFINFLLQSWRMTGTVIRKVRLEPSLDELQMCVNPPRLPWIREKTVSCLIPLLSFLCYLCDQWSQRMPRFLQMLLTVTTTGKQIACKSHHLKSILHDLTENRKITLLSGNLISAIILDSIFGLLVTCIFCDYLQPVPMVDVVIGQTDLVVNQLQQLLSWLMGVPAGLKLNLPLNSALGRFFLYHIYLWKTYIMFIKPFLLVMLECSMHFGILGLSFLISLSTDLFSLATLHVYCFYGYAARIYSLKLSGLAALWRLFRGKKWNPLRNRVDSFTYDVQQLFLGTLIFTVLIFLLPTVALYYAVFTTLRLVVLVLQIVLCKIVDVLTSFPLYVLILHFSGHSLVKGDVNMKVVSSTQESISLSLEVISISLPTVLSKTLPKRHFFVSSKLNEILRKVIFGEVIYPL